MSGLIEVREIIKRIYAKYDAYLNPLFKFILAMIVFSVINGKIGYMKKLDSIAIVLVVSLLCSFLPTIMMAILAGLFILLHLYALAMECALVAGVVMFLMFILYIRLVPNETIVVLMTPILFLLKIPYILPLALGLLGGPASVVSVAFGIVLSQFIEYAGENASTIETIDDGNMVSRIRFIVDGMLGNKSMFALMVAFGITLVSVYSLRKLSINHSWTIATVAGAIADMIIMLICDLKFDLNFSIVGMIIGSIFATLICIVLQFFEFHLDYKNTENVQFEDDDYYYYVKAVPKVKLKVTDKKVKKINTARSTSNSVKAHSKSANRTVHTANTTTRAVRK